MLNEKTKQAAIDGLVKANDEYSRCYRKTVQDMEMLLNGRKRAIALIRETERFFKALANKPREIEQTLGSVQLRRVSFEDRLEALRRESIETEKGRSGIGTGVVAGISCAAAPGAAMAIAMTFGTASTGVAISTLSGAAATNAALAWLGGGAIAAGGAGVAGGQALLGALGPVGWIIGGGVAIGSTLAVAIKNDRIAKEAEKSTITIIKERNRIQEIDVRVLELKKRIEKLTIGISKKLTVLRKNHDYSALPEEMKQEISQFINLVETLSKATGETLK